jgi:hypothetical protein
MSENRKSIILGFTVIFSIIQTCVFLLAFKDTLITRPFWDMFGWIEVYLDYKDSGGFVRYLWHPHNEHYLLVIRILTAVDVSQFGARGLALILSATAALLVSAVLIYNIGSKAAGSMKIFPILLYMLFFTVPAAVDCSIPINGVYPICLLFMIGSLVVFDGSSARLPTHSPIRLVSALFLSVLASLTNAVGLVTFVALLWSAWRGRRGGIWLAAICIVGALYGGIYIATMPAHSMVPEGGFFTPNHVAKMANYLATYLGLPLSRSATFVVPARIAGGMLFLLGIVVIVRDAVIPRVAGDATRRIAMSFIIVALCASVLATIGRADLDEDVKVPVRYALLVSPLHLGLLLLLLPHALKWAALDAMRNTVLHFGVFAFAAVILLAQMIALGGARSAAGTINATLDRFDAGIREPSMVTVVFPDLGKADAIRTRLRTASSPVR